MLPGCICPVRNQSNPAEHGPDHDQAKHSQLQFSRNMACVTPFARRATLEETMPSHHLSMARNKRAWTKLDLSAAGLRQMFRVAKKGISGSRKTDLGPSSPG